MSTQGSTYIRWEATTCSCDAMIYTRETRVDHIKNIQGLVSTRCVCLKIQCSGRMYGAEYKTDTYRSWIDRNNHGKPCAVCQTTRNIGFMVPGKNVCHKRYTLE